MIPDILIRRKALLIHRKVFFIFILGFLIFTKPAFAVTFNISNPQLNGNEVIINASMSGLTSTSCLNGSCYLQAAFTAQEQNKYFGFTKNNNGDWYEYVSSPSTSDIQSTFFAFQPVSGSWSGQMTLKINSESPNYKSSGTYNVKAWRYSGKSSSAAGDSDNILAVDIQGPTPTPSPTPIPSSTPSPSSTPTTKKSSTPPPQPSLKPSSTPLTSTPLTPPSPKISDKAEVAGVAKISSSSSASPSVQVASQKQNNFPTLIFLGGGLILAACSYIIYEIIKQAKKSNDSF